MKRFLFIVILSLGFYSSLYASPFSIEQFRQFIKEEKVFDVCIINSNELLRINNYRNITDYQHNSPEPAPVPEPVAPTPEPIVPVPAPEPVSPAPPQPSLPDAPISSATPEVQPTTDGKVLDQTPYASKPCKVCDFIQTILGFLKVLFGGKK